MELLIKGSTDVVGLSRSIIASLKDTNNPTSMATVGAGSLNQAVKAVIIAQSAFASHGKKIAMIPCFSYIEGTDVTKIVNQLILI